MRSREAIIELIDPPPLLVVEVVSDSTVSTDYRAKHSEYSVLEIPEYWIIDPAQGKITVSTLREGRYDDEVFKGDDAIHADIFPQLVLTARPIPGATLSP